MVEIEDMYRIPIYMKFMKQVKYILIDAQLQRTISQNLLGEFYKCHLNRVRGYYVSSPRLYTIYEINQVNFDRCLSLGNHLSMFTCRFL